MFSQHLSGTRNDQACQNQGSVFNIIKIAVKTVNITENQKEERKTSLGKASGEETDPTFLSTILGDYRSPLVSTLGTQQRPGVLTKGRATPGAGSGEVVSPWRVWKCAPVQALRIVWPSPHPRGSGSCVHGDHMSALSLQCVLSPRRFPASELRVLP